MLGVGPRIDFKTWKKILYFWLCWIFVAAGGLSLVAEGGGFSSLQRVGASRCGVFAPCRAQALGTQASVVAA